MKSRNGHTKKRKSPAPKRNGKPASFRLRSGAANRNGGEAYIQRENSIEYKVNGHSQDRSLSTIDLFCGAGGITEGFRRAGFRCQYANDIEYWAIETFRANHPSTRADNRPIEKVDAAALRRVLGLAKGELDVIVGGPPCQGFSINAPEWFLDDPRNSLFKHYLRFLDEFEPKSLLIENVPGMLSLGGGVIFDKIVSELTGTRATITSPSCLKEPIIGEPEPKP